LRAVAEVKGRVLVAKSKWHEERSEQRDLVSKTVMPLRGLELYDRVLLVEVRLNKEGVIVRGRRHDTGVGATCQGR
jgi:hypothetical protein